MAIVVTNTPPGASRLLVVSVPSAALRADPRFDPGAEAIRIDPSRQTASSNPPQLLGDTA